MPPAPFDRSARMPNGQPYPAIRHCPACNQSHPIGSCPLKIAGVENCPLCGIAHFGHARVCPHIKSETQVVEMLHALKHSAEPKHLVELATKYLRGVKGTLVQAKKQAREKAERMRALENGGQIPATGSGGEVQEVQPSVEERLLAAWERERV
jgi:chromodomain-helicase-DNA-binding protein 4